MADRNVVCYSFYVPEQDTQLRAFLAAQSNLSLSMRLLAKAFLAHGADSGADISVADLGVLVNAMQPGNVAGCGMPAKKGRKRHMDGAGTQAAPAAPAADMTDVPAAASAPAQEPAQEPAQAAAAAASAPEQEPVQEAAAATAEHVAAEPVLEEPVHGEPVQQAHEAPADASAQEAGTSGAAADVPGGPDPASEDAQDGEDDIVPSIEQDGPGQEQPAGGQGSREAYNRSMAAGIPMLEEDEDIEAFMGDVG